MGKLSQKSIIEKADLAVSNLIDTGGYLNPMQSDTFVRMLVDQPTILNELRVVPMNAPTMEINKIGFANRILRAAPASGQGSALGTADRSAPTSAKVELATKEIIAQVDLTYDVLEDSIERGTLEQTVMSMISEQTSIDLEELIILGYTHATDPYLALFNGLLVSANQHVVHYTTPPTLDVDIFKDAIQTLPTKYLRNRSMMKFYTSHYVESEFAAQLARRETILGDIRTTSDYSAILKAFGVPIAPCAMMPDANYIFTIPQNLILGIQRKVQVETDRFIRERVFSIVLTMRVAFAIEEPDAVVKASGLTAAGTTTY